MARISRKLILGSWGFFGIAAIFGVLRTLSDQPVIDPLTLPLIIIGAILLIGGYLLRFIG